MMILEPAPDCRFCPRLAAFRDENKLKFPVKFNAPVPSFGPIDASLLIVGLAPGLKGANFPGRPFTGDYAGDLLCRVIVETPVNLSRRQKELMKEFSKLTDSDMDKHSPESNKWYQKVKNFFDTI